MKLQDFKLVLAHIHCYQLNILFTFVSCAPQLSSFIRQGKGVAQQGNDELGALASPVTGVYMDLKAEAGTCHACIQLNHLVRFEFVLHVNWSSLRCPGMLLGSFMRKGGE